MKKLFVLLLAASTLSIHALADSGSSSASFASFYSLTGLPDALKVAATAAYTYKAKFFEGVAKGIESGPAIKDMTLTLNDPGIALRSFVMNSLEPVISDTQSPWFEKHVREPYNKARSIQNKRLRISSLGEIPRTPEVVRIALIELKEGWMALRPFLTSEQDRYACEAIVGSIGRALASNDLRALRLEQGDSMLEALQTQPRTRGLAIMVKSVSLFLSN